MGSNNFWRSNLNLGVYFFLDCGTFNDYLDTLLDFCDRLLNYFYMDILFTKKSQAGALLMIFRLFMEGKFDAYVLYWSKGKPFYIFWIICPAFVSLTFLIKQNKIFVFFCRVHSIFCFSLFGNSDQKQRNKLFCLFIFCIKIRNLPENDSRFFWFLVTLTKQRKTKDGMNRTKEDKTWTRHLWFKNGYNYKKTIHGHHQNKYLYLVQLIGTTNFSNFEFQLNEILTKKNLRILEAKQKIKN